jgi:G2/mitotic-specific cyclin-B, other
VAELLDRRLADHLNDVSEVLVKKYNYAFYSKASTVVLQYYLAGNRFSRFPIPDLFPATPNRSYSSSLSGTPTPLSTSTSFSSVSSDDMPSTPSRITCMHDPFVSVTLGNQKENNRPANLHLEDVLLKRSSIDGGIDFTRPVLQNLNGVSPSPRTILR